MRLPELKELLYKFMFVFFLVLRRFTIHAFVCSQWRWTKVSRRCTKSERMQAAKRCRFSHHVTNYRTNSICDCDERHAVCVHNWVKRRKFCWDAKWKTGSTEFSIHRAILNTKFCSFRILTQILCTQFNLNRCAILSLDLSKFHGQHRKYRNQFNVIIVVAH